MVNNSKTGKERGLVFTEKKLKFFELLSLIVQGSKISDTECWKSEFLASTIGVLTSGINFLSCDLWF